MNSSRFNITGFTLKVLAIIGMACNHVAHIFMPIMPHWLTFLLFSLGGLTYPIMAYIMVEGYLHTSNLKKYFTRLGIFALISQVPFTLLFGWTANVMITLLMGLFLLWAWDNVKQKPLFALIFVVVEALSYFCDWALTGPLMVFLFYYLRKRGSAGVAITMLVPYLAMSIPAIIALVGEVSTAITDTPQLIASYDIAQLEAHYLSLHFGGIPLMINMSGFYQICNLGYVFIGLSLSWFFILFYNGKRGRSMKWFFYVFYPLHLLIIWVLKLILL